MSLERLRGQSARVQERNVAIVRGLCAWFASARRDLPWRLGVNGSGRDPYASLVSEVMLQQTQVSRVVERYGLFLERFPTVRALAEAPEADVLALWSGMGYYRRARNLQAAAQAVVERHEGIVPRDVNALRALPGVGRYTAGAIASIVFGEAEATVDGNVARVLLRVDGREFAPEEGLRWAWDRATKLVKVAACDQEQNGPGVLNEALMELGAVVCTPRRPRCKECCLRSFCRAAAKGKQDRIPKPKVRAARRVRYCAAVVLEDEGGRLLVEQRRDEGMWGGLWQVVTIESDEGEIDRSELERVLNVKGLERVTSFTHVTTHRDMRFTVWERDGLSAAAARRVQQRRRGTVWKFRDEVLRLGISNAQRRVVCEVSNVD